MVRKNEYPRKDNLSKDVSQVSEPVHSSSQQKTFPKNGEFHKENNPRNNRPPRENQQRDNYQQKDFKQRDVQKRENFQRDNQPKENTQRDNTSRDSQNKDNYQRNHHRDNNPNRDAARDSKEPFRPHFQRPIIKPRADETVEDIAADIGRIEKEIELELKEIKSMRLGI